LRVVVALADTIRSRLVLLVMAAHGTRFRCAFAGALMDRHRGGLSPNAHGNADTDRRSQQEQHALERDKPAKPGPGQLQHGWTVTAELYRRLDDLSKDRASEVRSAGLSLRGPEAVEDIDRCS
jgi:hypothetical protein